MGFLSRSINRSVRNNVRKTVRNTVKEFSNASLSSQGSKSGMVAQQEPRVKKEREFVYDLNDDGFSAIYAESQRALGHWC